ncbi:hypothetical protein CANCADRAFT_142708 [Tortispora caseinolytica NRRL Y-17796]|uniref:YEATS domain-containing protein n=1 Tax=Tortispora caseinolytica NRRL Y-17796 TaxID=767744 RepID=A0A1E4TD81_9ASCO|nr:hypothetical protein CANCADRAFT_142708 [Tortispora caseinolytica NRRL Y-17796]
MSETTTRTIRITTQNEILKDLPPIEAGFPMRKWSIQVNVVGPDGELLPASVFDEIVYHLHPTFDPPVVTLDTPPFLLEQEGWGEFDMLLTLKFVDGSGETSIKHDLNFLKQKYTVDHKVKFPTSNPALARVLAESGPLTADSKKRKTEDSSSNDAKRAATNASNASANGVPAVKHVSGVDVEKLADYLYKLGEDDLLQIVQMVSKGKSADSYVKNLADEGEFHMDLYTLPNSLLKNLWDFTKKRVSE